ncbi:glutathione S-transferase family protein [Synechococcus sp. RSCCF101]|uniref:glutathione S-transferase family protein n=1 Tax=Synechococcus sp. RSCCF101 TaxID=2511069 RepID=UPI00124663DB|nr:glutathione S-transferase family protein [Synechococcus sp. RSCCF101]QEY31264.1 glutathione S-transferase family protein [Synechococcus sp. RSCCF101]
MGLLVDGVWTDQWYDTSSTGGRFERSRAVFRNWLTADGSPGPTGRGGFAAEAGRYHLYVSLACPWAHRTLIVRALKGLNDLIPISVVHWYMGKDGWTFADGEGVIPDPNEGVEMLHQLYTRAEATYSGRVTVPVLWDKQTRTIVSNESSEIIRMFNSAFDGLGAREGNYYPAAMRSAIDAVNDVVYPTINNGVYRCGFATTQAAYEEALTPLFDSLDQLEQRLTAQRYLLGSELTEADVRLFTTLLRFDPVYVGHFKCNLRRIADYPALFAYTRDLYQHPGVAATVNLNHIKRHYYESHHTINPTGVVPVGPEIDYGAPHGREALSTMT